MDRFAPPEQAAQENAYINARIAEDNRLRQLFESDERSQFIEDLKDRYRLEIEEDVRDRLHDEVQADFQNEVDEEVERQKDVIRDEVRDELIQELRTELREDIEQELRWEFERRYEEFKESKETQELQHRLGHVMADLTEAQKELEILRLKVAEAGPAPKISPARKKSELYRLQRDLRAALEEIARLRGTRFQVVSHG